MEAKYNNGWIKLNGTVGEINTSDDIWIITESGLIEILRSDDYLPLGYATHWQPIEKPKPPIY